MNYGDPEQSPPPGPGGWPTQGALPSDSGFPPAPSYGQPPTSGYGLPSGFPPAPGYGPPAGPGWGTPVPPPPPARSSAKVAVVVTLAIIALCVIGAVYTPLIPRLFRSSSTGLVAGVPVGLADGPKGQLAVAAHQSGGKTYVKLLKGGRSTDTEWKTELLGFNSYSYIELQAAGPYVVAAGPSTTEAPKVVWLERSSGEVKGEVTLPGSYVSARNGGFRVVEGRTDGTVVVASRDLLSLVRPGSVVWKGKGISDPREVHVAGDLLFPGVESDGSVQTVKLADGSTGAKFQLDCANESAGGSGSGLRYRGDAVAQVSGTETVTVLSDASRNVCMVRFDAATGAIKQRVRSAGKLGLVSKIMVVGDKAVAAGPLGNAAHLDLAANTVTVINDVKGLPVAKLGNVVVLQPDSSSYQAGAAAGIDATSGKILWRVPIPARRTSANETEDRQVIVSGDKVAMVVIRRVERNVYLKVVSIDPQKGPSLQGKERLLTSGVQPKVWTGPAGSAIVVVDRTLFTVPLEANSTPVKRS